MLSADRSQGLLMADVTEEGKQSVEQMIGEMLREVAVLVLVFVPLDALLAPETVPDDSVALMVTIAVAAGALGIMLERLRD